MPSTQPSLTGEGAGCRRFCGRRQFEKQLGFSAVDFRSSEKQKVAHTTHFPYRTLHPSSYPILSPVGESQREGNKPQGLYFRRLRDLGKVAATWRIPSPQPSPTGEGAYCSRFRRCRSSEKRMPKTSTAGIFQVTFYRKADGTNAASVFSDDL